MGFLVKIVYDSSHIISYSVVDQNSLKGSLPITTGCNAIGVSKLHFLSFVCDSVFDFSV